MTRDFLSFSIVVSQWCSNRGPQDPLEWAAK